MATKPTIATVAVGQKISASLWNNAVYQDARFWDVTKPVCLAYQTVVQSLTSGTFTAITMDSEQLDSDGQHSTSSNTSRIVIGNTLGWYRVSGYVAYNTAAGGNTRDARLILNGATVNPGWLQESANSGGFASAPLQPVLVQSTLSTDYIELQGRQSSGGAVSTVFNSNMLSYILVEYIGTMA